MPYYEFHFDINFDATITRDERKQFQQSLFSLLQPFGKEEEMKVRKYKTHLIAVKKEKFESNLIFRRYLHIGIRLEEPSQRIIELANDLSNKVTGFATTLPNRSIKLVDFSAFFDAKVKETLVAPFVKIEKIADLSSKLKINLNATGLALQSKRNGWEILVTFYSYRRRRMLIVGLTMKSKEAPWDIVRKAYEELNNVANPLMSALEVGLEHG